VHGLVSLLPEPLYARVESIWDELEREHGLRGIRVIPYPHFRWESAEEYDFAALEGMLRHLAREITPFTVRTAGLGLFTGERPAVYVPVIKNAELVRLHMRVWDSVAATGNRRSPLYAPDCWMPHVLLACEDADQGRLGPLIERLAWADFSWEFRVDHFAVIESRADRPARLRFRIRF
jgi:2'-5' RNA ligase